jgi:hypothetical protein
MNLVKSYRLTPAGYKKAYENGLCDVLSMPLGEEVVEWSNQMLPEDEREPSLVSQRLSDLSAQAVVEETLAQGLQPDEYQVRDHTAEYHRFLTTAPEGYDGFGTVTLETLGVTAQGRTLRVVGVLDDARDWQVTRYRSGNYLGAVYQEGEVAFWLQNG